MLRTRGGRNARRNVLEAVGEGAPFALRVVAHLNPGNRHATKPYRGARADVGPSVFRASPNAEKEGGRPLARTHDAASFLLFALQERSRHARQGETSFLSLSLRTKNIKLIVRPILASVRQREHWWSEIPVASSVPSDAADAIKTTSDYWLALGSASGMTVQGRPPSRREAPTLTPYDLLRAGECRFARRLAV